MKTRILSHSHELRACLLGGLLFGATVHAATATTRENPYAKPIVGRNAFGLNATQPQIIVQPPLPPPPRITLQGVTTILGRRQVLFKFQSPSKLGEPASEISCVLSEGGRQGDIEVLEIDDRTATIKFNNHGTVQTLTMKDG